MAAPSSARPARRPRRIEVRRRLLDAAGRVFAGRGIAGATLEDVAVAAGLTKGAIYSNFAGKDDLVLALMHEHIGERERLAAAALESAADVHTGVRDMGAALAAVMASETDWQRLFVEFWLRAQRDPAVLEQFARRRGAARAAIASRIGEAMTQRGLASPFGPDELAVTLLALSNGLALEQLTDPAAVPDGLFGRLLERLLS